MVLCESALRSFPEREECQGARIALLADLTRHDRAAAGRTESSFLLCTRQRQMILRMRRITQRSRSTPAATVRTFRFREAAGCLQLPVRALYFGCSCRLVAFLPLTGKRASRRRDCAEPVQTQSRVRGPCLGLHPANYSRGVPSPCTK